MSMLKKGFAILRHSASGKRILQFLIALIMLGAEPPAGAIAQAATVTSKGNVDGIAVMELTGNYDANLPDGSPNSSPRTVITKEFYMTHKDEYDFVVIFSNFDFAMPWPGDKAFYKGIKNDVQGIGLAAFDRAADYGSAGKLQGIIEMGNIANLASDPANPTFEETLTLLTHQMMHRWGADIKFLDGAGAESPALLSNDGNYHWSFLLDTDGSVLHGNHWRNNGDGTFTSIEPTRHSVDGLGRVLNPLDLYLMGISEAAQVPTLLLIENATDLSGVPVDSSRLPEVGVTINGTARYVAITDILATEGLRVPSAIDASKVFRAAFIYLVAPGSFPDAGLVGVEAIRNAWVGRFSALTDGKAVMEATPTPSDDVLPANPGVTPPTVTPTPMPDVNQGITWLATRQRVDGCWRDMQETAQRDTAAAVLAMSNFIVGNSGVQGNVQNGLACLSASSAVNTDYLAREIEGLARSGQNASVPTVDLLTQQNVDGGWGSEEGYQSNPLDTAMALKALHTIGYADQTVASKAIVYLKAKQNVDGGWSEGPNISSAIQPTVGVLSAMNAYRHSYQLDDYLNSGTEWLAWRQNLDGGFGNGPSTVYDTAMAVAVLRELDTQTSLTSRGVSYLRNAQAGSGSWNESVYQTALAAEALWHADAQADLSIDSRNISFTPPTVAQAPAEATVNASIANTGRADVSQARVIIYRGNPAAGGTVIGEQTVAVPGQTATVVSFTTTISADGLYDYYLAADPDNAVQESNEENNSAHKTLNVNVPHPKLYFEKNGSMEIESTGSVTVNITLSKAWFELVTIEYAVNSLLSTAASDVDYHLSSGTLTFSPGETTKTIAFDIIDDTLVDDNETIVIDLSNPINADNGTSRHTVTILDNEPPMVTITAPSPGFTADNTPLLGYSTSSSVVKVKVDGTGTADIVNKASGESLDPLNEGAHFVRVEATNAAGITGAAEVLFAVDTQLPIVTILSPRPGETKDADPLLLYDIRGNATSVVVRLNGPVINKTSGDHIGPLAEGAYTLTVEAANALNHTVTASVQFMVTQLNMFQYDFEWTKMANVSSYEYAYGVAADAEGAIYVTGDGNDNFLLAKYDSRGVRHWMAPMTSSMIGRDVVVDKEGNVYVTGYKGIGTAECNAFVVKYSGTGLDVAERYTIYGLRISIWRSLRYIWQSLCHRTN